MKMQNIEDTLDGVTDHNARRITWNNPIEVLEWRDKVHERLFPNFLREATSYTGHRKDNRDIIETAFQDSVLNQPMADDETVLIDARTCLGSNI